MQVGLHVTFYYGCQSLTKPGICQHILVNLPISNLTKLCL